MQNELVERRGKWMVILKDFDLEIYPMKMMQGKGFTNMIFDSDLGLICQLFINEGVVTDVWYQDVVYYLLQNCCPKGMNSSQRREKKY